MEADDTTDEEASRGARLIELERAWAGYSDERRVRSNALCATVKLDGWWSWPEAVAWVGMRDLRAVATIRWLEENRPDHLEPSVAISARFMAASSFCDAG